MASVEGADNVTAVKMCDVVVLTVPFAGQAELLKQLKPSFRNGTVLIDATVPLATAVGGRATRLLGVWQGSAAEQAQEVVGKNVVGRCCVSFACRRRCWRAKTTLIATSSCAAMTIGRAAGRVGTGDEDSRRARRRRRQAGERAHCGSHDRAAHHAEHPAQSAWRGMAGDGTGDLVAQNVY